MLIIKRKCLHVYERGWCHFESILVIVKWGFKLTFHRETILMLILHLMKTLRNVTNKITYFSGLEVLIYNTIKVNTTSSSFIPCPSEIAYIRELRRMMLKCSWKPETTHGRDGWWGLTSLANKYSSWELSGLQGDDCSEHGWFLISCGSNLQKSNLISNEVSWEIHRNTMLIN